MDTIKRVQDLMQVRDMNLCVLAKKCGISYSTIQTTARRGGQLSVETIERICQGLGITLKDFFDSSDRKSTRLNSSHSRASRMPSSA